MLKIKLDRDHILENSYYSWIMEMNIQIFSLFLFMTVDKVRLLYIL